MGETRCVSCMRVIDENKDVCPYCGFQKGHYREELYYLPVGISLQDGRYQAGRVTGEGESGLDYIGWDEKFSQVVDIGEFYPKQIASRRNTVSPELTLYKQTDEEPYQQIKEHVIKEAKILKQYAGYQGILRVEDFFEENNTVYIVTEHIGGITLRQHLEKGGGMDAQVCLSMFRPLIRSLYRIHKTGVYHRDISLDQIILREEDGSLTLTGFAFAQTMGDGPQMTVKFGYAPPELYAPNKENNGPWIDVYSICVCLYNCITGQKMEDSKSRSPQEDIWGKAGDSGGLSKKQKEALKNGLELDYRKRLQSMGRLYEGLYEENLETVPEPEKPEKKKKSTNKRQKRQGKFRVSKKAVAAACIAGVLAAGIVVWKIWDSTGSNGTESEVITIEYADGSIYEGECKDGKRDGTGTVKYSDGSSYEGSWENDKRSGKGEYHWPDGKNFVSYEGEWEDNQRDGDGKLVYADGSYYDGSWKDDKWNGKGEFYLADGSHCEAEWIDNRREGKGIYYYSGEYEGWWAEENFKNNVMDGERILHDPDGNTSVEQWSSGERVTDN